MHACARHKAPTPRDRVAQCVVRCTRPGASNFAGPPICSARRASAAGDPVTTIRPPNTLAVTPAIILKACVVQPQQRTCLGGGSSLLGWLDGWAYASHASQCVQRSSIGTPAPPRVNKRAQDSSHPLEFGAGRVRCPGRSRQGSRAYTWSGACHTRTSIVSWPTRATRRPTCAWRMHRPLGAPECMRRLDASLRLHDCAGVSQPLTPPTPEWLVQPARAGGPRRRRATHRHGLVENPRITEIAAVR